VSHVSDTKKNPKIGFFYFSKNATLAEKYTLLEIEMNMIDARQLAALVDAGAVKTIAVKGTAGGFTILVDGKTIEARRGNVRVFKKLNAAASFLKFKGVGLFTVDVSTWNPDQKSII
jgi:hypothetical protein